jgi:aconitate hydratase
MLRKKGVVGKFVEFYGPGVEKMSLPDRATVANMGPEYGATLGYFPIDDETLNYLQRTGRSEQSIQLVERYAKEQGLFRSKDMPEPEYSDTISLDLDSVKPSVAGPKRPQDRYDLAALQSAFQNSLRTPFERGGFGLDDRSSGKKASVNLTDESSATLSHGAVVIAAITSCTNTSNPSVMLAAGLLAQKAVERGLSVPAYVKTSLAPGSRVVTEYLDQAGLTPYLNELGFYTVGYGCTTCIGNSGPLNEKVSQAIEEHGIVAAAVLSGNRNFEGRINPLTKANYLASPPLVIAYALAGTVDIDLLQDPLGTDRNGDPVYLKEIWPTVDSIINTMDRASNPETFKRLYGDIDSINPRWAEIPAQHGALYNWQTDSTYIQEPPFFLHLEPEPESISPIHGARVLVFLGDSVTTDHISPAGAIPSDSPAARYLQERGITPEAFNTYGSRRGNDRIMVRGTFGNIRLKNRLVGGVEGGWTLLLPDDRRMPIYDAAQEYGQRNTPLIVIAGREYGTGSSRDWAAKGTALLGIKAVLARSYERIHRSNLVGMGVLPLQFLDGESAEKLGLDGRESYTIHIDDDLSSGQRVLIEADSPNGDRKRFNVDVRLDTPVEVEYYRHGGILHTVLRNMLTE